MLTKAEPTKASLARRGALRLPRALVLALAAVLAGCAGNDAFVPTPAPAASTAAGGPAAPVATATTSPAAPAARRQPELPYPSVGTAQVVPNTRPVMDAAAQAKMEAELESLARDRERKLKQKIEQGE
ncbi:hypothetical protein [Ancylobacter terrae]|uniref:hypothetical protein n=1 Tax=Ancylobacter sp. sgz301288 TaxID=3342077 RepID=UPI00385B8BD5